MDCLIFMFNKTLQASQFFLNEEAAFHLSKLCLDAPVFNFKNLKLIVVFNELSNNL